LFKDKQLGDFVVKDLHGFARYVNPVTGNIRPVNFGGDSDDSEDEDADDDGLNPPTESFRAYSIRNTAKPLQVETDPVTALCKEMVPQPHCCAHLQYQD
jgi:hypothetical protein